MGQPTTAVPTGTANANAGASIPAGTTAPPPAVPPTPVPTTPANPTAEAPAPVFHQADVDRIVAERVSREKAKFADYDELKGRAAQWDALKEASRSETEKAVDTARTEAEAAGRKAAATQFGGALVEAHMAAAAAGRLAEPQLKALLAGMDPTRFLGENGLADQDKIRAFIDGIAPPAATPAATPPIPGGFGQGARPGAPKPSVESGAAEWERRHGKTATVLPLIT